MRSQDDNAVNHGGSTTTGGLREEFAAEFGRSERGHWCGKYLEGLLREGDRKSVEPLAARVGGDDQALQQFVNQSPWDHDAVMFRLRTLMKRRASEGGVPVLEDTSLPSNAGIRLEWPDSIAGHWIK